MIASLDASKAAGEAAQLQVVAVADESRTLRADATAAARVIIEMQAHIDDARNELDKSNARTTSVQHELDAIREAMQGELIQLKTALAIATSQVAVANAQEKTARKEKATAQQALLEAREVASVLRGQVETLTRQNTDLLDALKSS